jgi:uncharacterized protein (TIGR02453 family)
MVEPETFSFLAGLAANNRKAWMDEHRDAFDDARRNFTGIAMTLHSYAGRFDHSVADAKSKPKQSYTKLYQDPQYRSGPGPYRSDIDVFANAGNPTEDFGYYVHIEPGNCYAGAGLFQPSKPALAKLRKRISTDLQGLEQLVTDPEFETNFPDGLFTRKALSAVPIGFDSNDPAERYLKMAGMGCRQSIPEELLLDDDVIDLLVQIFRAASPLVRYFD